MIEVMNNKRYTLLICLVLVIAIITAYEPMRHNDSLSYDDDEYITENPHVTGGLTAESVKWAFTSPHFHMYHPLTSLSHMLDCELFGLNPAWHQLSSLFLHAVNTVLLFLVLNRMTGANLKSAFVAALFSLHPLHVETVA